MHRKYPTHIFIAILLCVCTYVDPIVQQVNSKSCKFDKEACRDSIKRNGDKIGMGYMEHS